MITHRSRIRAWSRTIAMLIGVFPFGSQAQVATEVAWQRCLGGSGLDWGSNLTGTSDGGFVCIGWSASNDGDATGSHGGNDIVVVKLDANGAIVWRRLLGGSSEDLGFSCMEASDGSIMIVGNTQSTDGDVTQNHGGQDLWILKLSPLGTIIWQHAYGGSGLEGGGQIKEVADGGFVINGITTSNDGDVLGFHPGGGVQDHWVLKIDPSGILEWNRALGGSDMDVGADLIQTADGGFLMNFGYTTSTDGDVINNHGGEDCWLVKLSATGSIEWSLTLGGSDLDLGYNILELGDGDFMLLGDTWSSDGDISVNQGNSDVLLARVSGGGSLLWSRTYGGSLDDDCRTLLRTEDGGFLMAGASNSIDGDVGTNNGEQDVWVLKVDANGSPQWHRSFGGSLDEWAFLREDGSAGYVLSGLTDSNGGDVQGNHGDRDLWLFQITDNGDLLWQRCLGGSAEDWGYVLARTSDGYVACGYTDSNDGDVSGNHGGRDMWVVKLKVSEPMEPLECALYIPNAISPDNSTKNDRHCLYGTDCIKTMVMDIYDRWGNKVFESTDPNACWDGTYDGQPLDPAVFVYYLSATMNNGESVERQGNITLMR